MLQIRHEGQRVGRRWETCESLREFENFMGTKAHVDSFKRRVYVSPIPKTDPVRTKRPPKAEAGEKLRYRVTINWKGELKEVWTYAFTEVQALAQVVQRLAPELRYRARFVLTTLIGTPGSWEAKHE